MGISISDNGDRLKLHNMSLMERTLDHFEMSESNLVSKLLLARIDLSCQIGDDLERSTPYRQIIGALMHLASAVRPDISYAVH